MSKIYDIAEQISSVSATLAAISDGIEDGNISRSLSWLAELLDQTAEDLYSAGGTSEGDKPCE